MTQKHGVNSARLAPAVRNPAGRALPVGLVSLAGLVLFSWPFLGTELSAGTPAWALMLACVAGLFLVEAGTRQLDSRAIALLAAIAALDSALRLAVIVGIGGFNPIFFLVLCSGFVFGTSFGFMAGALSILVSALIGGGIGPWVPYQVFALGWVGVAAGLAGRWRSPTPGLRDVLLLGHLSGADQYHPVGERIAQLRVVRGEDDGGPCVAELRDHLDERSPSEGVHAAGRLVKEDEVGPSGEDGSQGGAVSW